MNFKYKLTSSLNEKDVENVYRSEFSNINTAVITSPFNVDGILVTDKLNVLLEFKYDLKLKNKLDQCNVLIQCIYYLKKIENNGIKLPSLIFVGDINECFILHCNSVLKYLSYDIDWDIAPSNAYKYNSNTISKMLNDDDISPFVYDVTNEFDFNNVVNKLNEFNGNIIRKIRISKHNIVNVFNYFNENVLIKSKLTTNEKVNLFTQLIINPDDNYIHPKRKNILTTKSLGEIKVNQTTFNSFFKHFEGDLYSPKDKENLTSLTDRLIDDTVRRNKGEFFTPTAFVDLAHKYISDTFGEDWKEKYIVWDCAAGTLNLTRDYKFKELYISTLEQSDLDTAEQMGYNHSATKFQFDFLNDDDTKLPQTLQDALNSEKEVLFLINPPYARSANNGSNNKITKGINKSIVRDRMKTDNLSSAGQNLYSQFLYRIMKYQSTNKNIKLGLFSPPLFLTGASYKKFRNVFFNNFGFKKAMLFQASHFSDVSTQWGISFSVFSNKTNNINNEFSYDVINNNDWELEIDHKRNIYNIDHLNSLSKWIINVNKPVDSPKMSSALKVKETNWGTGIPLNSYGTLGSNSNNVYENNTNVFILNAGITKNIGKYFINQTNYIKCTSLFTARKLITGNYANWINCKDEYIAPNEQHSDYEQFQYDSIVYSLFNNSSQQSSLRDITYKDKQYNIKNEFFWLSKDDIMELANTNHYDELYKDAKSSDNRHVYKLLYQDGIYNKLSKDAKEVLNTATDLVNKSIIHRQLLSESNPDYHLDSWDAGYAQLKLVWKEYFSDEFKAFRAQYNEFADRLRPLVYELGFLKK